MHYCIEPGIVGELCPGGWSAARGVVYPAEPGIRRGPIGLACLGGDAAGNGWLIFLWGVYDPLDLEAGALVGRT